MTNPPTIQTPARIGWPKAELQAWAEGFSRTPATVLKAFIDAGLCSDQAPQREETRLFQLASQPSPDVVETLRRIAESDDSYDQIELADMAEQLAARLEHLRQVIADNDPNDAIADGGLTVWDGVRHDAGYVLPRAAAILASLKGHAGLDPVTVEADDLLPSYCRLIDAMQGDDPEAVGKAFKASIEAVSKFGLLRAIMDPTDV